MSRVEPTEVAAYAGAAAWAVLLSFHTPLHAGHQHGIPAPPGGPDGLAALAAGLPGWVVMTVAMMARPLLPAVAHVSANTLRWRRGRAALLFGGAYLAVWTAFGAAAILAVAAWAPDDRRLLLTTVLVAAACWQGTPWKGRALRAGHRSVPLPPRGRRAAVADVRFGYRHALACVASCWLLMLAMAVAASGHLLWTVAFAVVVSAERSLPRPGRTARLAGVALAAGAAFALA